MSEKSSAGTLSRAGRWETHIIKFLLTVARFNDFRPEFRGVAGQANDSDKGELLVIFTKLLLGFRADAAAVLTAFNLREGNLCEPLSINQC